METIGSFGKDDHVRGCLSSQYSKPSMLRPLSCTPAEKQGQVNRVQTCYLEDRDT